MSTIDRIRDWRTAQKLRRGQCDNCGKPLRDDDTTGFCGETCSMDWLASHAI